MDGILIIDKPDGLTSHDVVARVRRILKTKRVGHTGTLDPFATGVLVLLVGQATRLAQFLDKNEKEYEALVRLGFETDTGDKTGSPKSEVQSPKSVSLPEIEKVLGKFRGEIEQVPPMYSAKKIEGRKLYELAREGQEVKRAAVKINIRELELNTIPTQSDLGLGTWDLGLHVVCSAGTYIRTLAEDIGKRLGVGAHLQELRRTRAGKFDLPRSITIEQLESLDNPSSAFIPMPEAVSHLPKLILPAARVEKTRNGLASRSTETWPSNQPIRMLDESNNLIAVGIYDEAENTVRPKIVLV